MKPIGNIGVMTGVALAVQLANISTASAQDAQVSQIIEEVIVTATRREQNLQDIPLSVSAISGDNLRDGGVLDISRLKLLVPGLNFGQSGAYAHIAVRGARTEAIQVNTQPIISNYSDGIYRSGTEQFLGPMLDLNRVEVLRGPQGTLFGKNSYGGAIAVHTNRPEQEFDAAIEYTGGDYGLKNYNGMINFPITDTIAARIVAGHFEHDGYVENTFPGGDDIDDQDADYIRGALLFEFENSSLIVRGEYFDQGGHGSGGFAASLAGELPGGDVFEVPVPTNNTNSGCGSYSNVDQTLVVPNPGAVAPFSYANSTCPVPNPGDPYKIETNAPYFLDAEQKTFSIEFNADFDWGSMKLLGARTENENFRSNDGDQGPGTAYIAGENVEREIDQFEVHFVDNGQGDVSWLFGAFYLTEDSFDNFYFNSDSRDTTGNQFIFTAITKRTVDSDSMAVFGEVTFPVSDSTRVTVGARYSDEDYDWGVNFAGSSFTVQPIPVDIRDINLKTGEFAFMDPDTLISDDFNPITWRLALDHDLSEDSMIYGTVATGYAAGGMNSLMDPHTGSFTFDETDSIAYEVGYKATLRDGAMTLNIAAFYNDYKDFTAEPAGIVSGAVIVINRVGGDAEAKGIDLEMDWIPGANWLVNLRASVLDAEYGKFVTGLGGTLDMAGNRLDTYISVGTPESPAGDTVNEIRLDGLQVAFSPDYSLGLTVSYAMQLGAGGTLTPLLQFYYSDEYSASDQGYRHGQQDAYSQTDLRLTWVSANGQLNISGFVQNIEDEEVITRANIYGGRIATQYYAPPRTYGISIGYNFR